MAKVIAFPTKYELPKELKNRVSTAAKEYIYTLYDAYEYFDKLYDGELSTDDVTELLARDYAKALTDILNKLEEE